MSLDQALERGVGSVAEMRKISAPENKDTIFAHFNSFIYRFNAASLVADDGDVTVKPDVLISLQPGRWERTPIGSTGGGGGASFAENEFSATPAQTVFTLSGSLVPGGLSVLFVNGLGYAEGTEYTVSGTTLTWLNVPFILEAGDRVVIKFQV